MVLAIATLERYAVIRQCGTAMAPRRKCHDTKITLEYRFLMHGDNRSARRARFF